MDNKDVFTLCDDNVIYEIRLKEAINKGWLVPFRYYGIYDDIIDYDEINYAKGKYDRKQLEKALSIESRAEFALKYYKKHSSKRALGFCSTRKHAVFMAEYFSRKGINSCAVVSGNDFTRNGQCESCVMDKKNALEKLVKEEINVVFSVDIFNEGVDIREIDMVMFLRPTESPTIFMQQLGRGLRKARSKKYLNVLDFIGNYNGMVFLPEIINGDSSKKINERRSTYKADDYDLPDGCFADFDLKLIDLFRIQDENQKSLKDKVIDEYYRIKELLAKIPDRVDVYKFIDDDLYNTIRNRNDLNPFKDYLSFLDGLGELYDNENILVNTIAHRFLVEIENTSMNKTYKMPVLLAFYNEGNMKLNINDNDIYKSFRNFYSYSTNAIDLLRHESTRDFKHWDKSKLVSLAKRNPIKYLAKTSSGFFKIDGEAFNLTEDLRKYLKNDAFIKQFKDVIDYRTRKFCKEILKNKNNNKKQSEENDEK